MITSETDVKKRLKERKKPGSTTTLYRRGRELIQLRLMLVLEVLLYFLIPKDPSMMIWARHHKRRERRFPDWVVENNSYGDISRKCHFFIPNQIRTDLVTGRAKVSD